MSAKGQNETPEESSGVTVEPRMVSVPSGLLRAVAALLSGYMRVLLFPNKVQRTSQAIAEVRKAICQLEGYLK